jgi:hypothetical protein
MILRHRHSRPAFIFLDVMTGLILSIALALALTLAMTAHSRAAARFADERSAVYFAERILTELQSHRPVPAAPDDAKIEVKPLYPIPDLSGKSWAQVKAIVHGRTATLVGWIPSPEVKP